MECKNDGSVRGGGEREQKRWMGACEKKKMGIRKMPEIKREMMSGEREREILTEKK